MQREKKTAIPDELLYNSEDFWIKPAEEATIGLTDYGQANIGDILYLNFVPVGTMIRKGERCGSIESGKWVGNLLSPISGVVTETNSIAETDPHNVNTDPFGTGWLYRMRPANISEMDMLMNSAAYRAWICERTGLEGKERTAL